MSSWKQDLSNVGFFQCRFEILSKSEVRSFDGKDFLNVKTTFPLGFQFSEVIHSFFEIMKQRMPKKK
jgi:hypothetical protein